MNAPFSDYQAFNRYFINKYSAFISKYPYAFMLVEKPLRHFEAGNVETSQRILNNLSRFSLSKWIYKVYVFYILKIIRTKPIKIVKSISGFDRIDKDVSRLFRVNEQAQKKSFVNFVSLIFGRVIYLDSVATSSRIYSEYYKKIKVNGYCSITEDCLNIVNEKVKEDINKLADLICHFKIRLIISKGDSSASERILCEAARKTQCNYIVIAHGYVQDPKLITIAPIYADAIYMWTEKQCSDLRAVLDGSQRSKVKYEGCPLEYMKPNNNRVSDELITQRQVRFLFVLEPLPLLKKDRLRFLEILAVYINKVESRGFQPVLRLHPKDYGKYPRELNDIFSSVKISDSKNIYNDLKEYDCVVVTNSSVAVQAALLGLKSVQIKELQKFEFEFTELVSIQNFNSFLYNVELDYPRHHIKRLEAKVFRNYVVPLNEGTDF